MKFHTQESEETTAPPTIADTAGHRFVFRCYQREDIARSAIHDGAIIAWDPGLGKTMAMFSWPYVKRAKRVLIVAPASLHDQIILEGLEKFRATVTPIADQDAALALMRLGKLPLPGRTLSPVHSRFDLGSMPEEIAAKFQNFLDFPTKENFMSITSYHVLTGKQRHVRWSGGEGKGNLVPDENVSTNDHKISIWMACCAVDPSFPHSSLEITDEQLTEGMIHSALIHGGIKQLPLSEAPNEGMPEFFITDYRWLGYNGGDEWPDGFSSTDSDEGKTTDVTRRRRMALIASHYGMPGGIIRQVEQSCLLADKGGPAHQILGVPADAPRSTVKSAYRNLARLTHPDLHPEDEKATARMQVLNNALESMLKGDASALVKGIDDEVTELKPEFETFMKGVGLVTRDIKCVWEPTLSTLLSHCFDCVVCDEAVRLKSGTTYMAMGVLNLQPKYRLALTGTPIKNRLPDVFFLASWVCGFHNEATARWPYGNTTAAQSAFANNHLVMEKNLTKEQKSAEKGDFKRYIKQTNRVTSVNLLWKLLGPVIARRRKDQVGNDIVQKTILPLRVQPGTDQQRVYAWHLDNPPECKTPVASMGAQLQNLRQAALNPWTSAIGRPGCADSKSDIAWSPKMLAILHLAADLMAKGEQLVVFSPFQQFSTSLKSLLTEAGVPSLLLDGRVKNTKRGELAAEFKQGKFPVLIAGIQAMGEGHSFECASHLVLPSLDWAYDANRQAIDRVHRLTSRKDVTIYVMITTNSIDERLFTVFGEKGDASDLALDGRLFDDDKKEVSLADIIRSASLDFDPSATTLPETAIVAEWDTSLRNRLATAMKEYTMQRGTVIAAAASAAARKPATKPLPAAPRLKPAAAKPVTTQPSQPSFLDAMLPAHMPTPKPTALDAIIAQEVEDGKIVPFPFGKKPDPKPDPDGEARKRRVLAMLD